MALSAYRRQVKNMIFLEESGWKSAAREGDSPVLERNCSFTVIIHKYHGARETL